MEELISLLLSLDHQLRNEQDTKLKYRLPRDRVVNHLSTFGQQGIQQCKGNSTRSRPQSLRESPFPELFKELKTRYCLDDINLPLDLGTDFIRRQVAFPNGVVPEHVTSRVSSGCPFSFLVFFSSNLTNVCAIDSRSRNGTSRPRRL